MPDKQNRMSIAYLMSLTMAVGISISVARWIEWLRFPADNWYFGIPAMAPLDAGTVVVAVLYAVCITTFLFAVASGGFWESPGKILAMMFAIMCAMHWGLEAFAGGLVSHRVTANFRTPMDPFTALSRGEVSEQGFIWGIWYREFAPTIGYLVSLPLPLFVIWKSRKQEPLWRVVWVAFLIFNLLLVAKLYFRFDQQFPVAFRKWYFDVAIGLPFGMLFLAMLNALLRDRKQLDWWTVAVATPLIGSWFAVILMRLMS